MPQTNFCRLCVNIISADCESLFDENGCSNKIYETTAKYFDLMFFDMEEQAKQLTVICYTCWRHVSDFHNFQQAVIEAQTKLVVEKAKEVEVVVRSDVEFLFDQIPEDCRVSTNIPIEGVFSVVEEDVEADEQFISVPELELFYVHDSDSQFSMDEEECATESNRSGNEDNTKTSRDTVGDNSMGFNVLKEVLGESTNTKAAQQQSKDGLFLYNYVDINRDHLEGANSDGNFSEDDEDVAITDNTEGNPNKYACIDHDDRHTQNPYQCKICQKTFTRLSSVKRHMYVHDTGTDKVTWSCDQCNVQLKSRFGLTYHKQVAHHDGTTVCVCNVCGKIAATAVHLRRHYKSVHQPNRKHMCTVCFKTFKHPLGLREHMATHTGQDLYQCPYCTRTFKSRSTMHRHRKKTHPKEWAEGRKDRPNFTKTYLDQISHQLEAISNTKCI